jgi:hypothetical protein
MAIGAKVVLLRLRRASPMNSIIILLFLRGPMEMLMVVACKHRIASLLFSIIVRIGRGLPVESQLIR